MVQDYKQEQGHTKDVGKSRKLDVCDHCCNDNKKVSELSMIQTTILAKIVWDTLAECNAATIDHFSHGEKHLLGQNPLHRVGRGGGGGGGVNIAGIPHKSKVHHIFWPGL